MFKLLTFELKILGEAFKITSDKLTEEEINETIDLIESRFKHIEEKSLDKSSQKLLLLTTFNIALDLLMQNKHLERCKQIVEEAEETLQ